MGCDIHAVFQIKNLFNEKYQTRYVDIIGYRNYHLFSLIAGVRRNKNDNYFIPPKGLPEDFLMCENNHIYYNYFCEIGGYWMGDHSHSYLSADELKSIYNKTAYEPILSIINFMESSLSLSLSFSGSTDANKARIVFGFDN